MRFRIAAAAFCMVLSGISATRAATRISDPEKFVKAVYAMVIAGKPAPDDINTPRLQALYDLNSRDFGPDEVGRIDFDIWMNAQDSEIKDLKISAVPVDNGPGRKVVTARFKNFGKPQEVHFYFEKTKVGWRLDDARGLTGPEPWTLSLILKYGWDGKN